MRRYLTRVPEGMQDYALGECLNKATVQNTLLATFFGHGYRQVETPVLEYFDVFFEGGGETAFKTFDREGRILVVRPDNTLPIARLAATQLKDQPMPLRLCCCQDVCKFPLSRSGQLRAFTQAGIELIGESDAKADAEVIALAIKSLSAIGLNDFQLDLGHVGFFHGLMEESGLSEAQADVLLNLVEQKNMLEIELFLKDASMKRGSLEKIMRLPELYGGAETLDAAADISRHPRCVAAITNLRNILNMLTAYGVDQYISVELGLLQSAQYYTGMVFRGYTRLIGQPIVSGGRYDHLARRFGCDLPATGFGLPIKPLLSALDRQSPLVAPPSVDVAVGYEGDGFAYAIAYADELRRGGQRVEMCYEVGRGALTRFALTRGIARAVCVSQEGVTWTT